MHDSDKSNLLSIALCYVTDEMASERRAEFESQLAEDQSAREAVARAVLIAEGVRFVEAPLPHSPRPTVSRMQRATPLRYRIWPVAVAAAACLAVAFVLQFSSSSKLETTGGPIVSVSTGTSNSQIIEAEHLVDAWSQSELAVAGDDEALLAGNIDSEDTPHPADDDFENSDGFYTSEGVENGEETRLMVPVWMLAAVSLSLDLEEFDRAATNPLQPLQEN